MLTQSKINIRVSSPSEDTFIAEHFYKMWRDLDVPEEAIQTDWAELVQQYIQHARQHLGYAAFIAEIDGQIVGSAGCQVFAGLYPQILKEDYRKYGYIWGVYVEPTHRRQGIAKALTQEAIAHLKLLGCTRAVLNASPLGKPVYVSLGFLESNAMYLELV